MAESSVKYQKCDWCDKDSIELFVFTWEETGDKDFICNDCLDGIEFVKEVKL